MRIYNLKKMSIPKVAVLATGLTAAVLVATMSPQAAQAYPNKAKDCSGCHNVGGTVSAVPSATTLAAGAAYTVLVTVPANAAGKDTGYWIANSDASGTTGTSVMYGGYTGTDAATYTAAMTAPATAGTTYYKVWATNGDTSVGLTNFVLYSITVSPAATTPPVTTTTPPVTTTTPPVTTTTPPVETTTPPVETTTPPVETTTPPVETTTPPVETTTPPVETTTPPVETTTPPVTGASIASLSPTHGVVGNTVTIAGAGFGTNATVAFGAAQATATSLTDTQMVVTVPATESIVRTDGDLTRPFWYQHDRTLTVTVTPEGGTASLGVTFTLDSPKGHDDGRGDHRDRHGRHHS